MTEWIHQHLAALALLALLLGLAALTTLARTSFAAVNRRQLRRGEGEAAVLSRILRHPLRVHACLSLFSFALYAGIATLALALVEARFAGLAIAGIFLAILVGGEITPRAIAIRHASWWALRLAGPSRAVVRLLAPWMAGVNGLLRWILQRTHRTSLESLSRLGPSEIRALLEESEAVGIANPLEREMVERLLSLNSIEAWEVMIPREKLLAIPDTETLEEAFRKAAAWKISRLPVYGRDLDDLWGFVTVTRKARWTGAPEMTLPLSTWRGASLEKTAAGPVGPLVREPQETKIERLLHQMRQASARLVVLTSADGKTAGMLSLENLISAVVGEIAATRAGGDGVTWLADRVLFEGWLPLETVRSTLGLPAREDEQASLAGYLAEHLGRTPLPGDRLEQEGHEFLVRQSGYGQGISVLVRATGTAAARPGAGEVPS